MDFTWSRVKPIDFTILKMFQVNLAASQPMSFLWQQNHMDSLETVHGTITDLTFLFTIWSTELTMADPFPLGRESFSWTSNVTIFNVQIGLESRSSNPICFTNAPNHCWFSIIKQIGKIIKGLVATCHQGVTEEPSQQPATSRLRHPTLPTCQYVA